MSDSSAQRPDHHDYYSVNRRRMVPATVGVT